VPVNCLRGQEREQDRDLEWVNGLAWGNDLGWLNDRVPAICAVIDRTESRIGANVKANDRPAVTKCVISSETTILAMIFGEAIQTRRGGVGIAPIAGRRGV
jgi:hypothetical protein